MYLRMSLWLVQSLLVDTCPHRGWIYAEPSSRSWGIASVGMEMFQEKLGQSNKI